MTEAKVVATNLIKRYGNYAAVNGVSLTVHAGEIFGLLGPNGAGKTTTIELVEGLRRPDGGTALICGFDSVRQNREVRHRIGLSLQSTNLSGDSTVLEVLNLYASLYPNPLSVPDLLEQFNLTEKVRARCSTLSGGQKQRLAIALALVGRPEVIFLDEPTTGLDPQARQSLWGVIRSLRQDGRAVIMSTHYMEEAEQLCDRVAIMDHGQILAQGTPRDLARTYGPESAIELDLSGSAGHLATLSRLQGVTGIKSEGEKVVLHTATTATTLMALAGYARDQDLALGDLRTRSPGMEDVFITLTGRGLRD